MAIGQAAGTAAAQAVSTKRAAHEIDLAELRQTIVADGGMV
jgi:hypothetical protein